GGADVLVRHPVREVGEEVRDDVVGLIAAEQVQGSGLALVEGDVPVLHAEAPAAVRDALVLRDVAGGEDAGGCGLQAGVHDDAAKPPDLETGGAGETDVGHRADADDHRLGVELETGLGDYAG